MTTPTTRGERSPFEILQTPEFAALVEKLQRRGETRPKVKKLRATIRTLAEEGPGYPGLVSHEYKSLAGPRGETLWSSYIENATPSAWRLWWFYGPTEGYITLVNAGPHPD